MRSGIFALTYMLIVSIIHGEPLRSFSGMITVNETAQRKFMRLNVGLDETSYDEVSSGIKKRADEYRIHIVGDSTMRNQWLALCSLLNVPLRELEVRNGSTSSRQCIGEGWGYRRLIATGTFDRSKPIASKNLSKIITNALKAYTATHFNVIYFGSTALHMLQLFPPYDIGDKYWPLAANLKHEVSEMIRVVRTFTSCPIFQTMHYVCDGLFTGEWAQALRDNYGENRTELNSICRKRLPRAPKVCEDFSMTSEGSIKVAQIERHGIESSSYPNIGVVDTFSLTYKQCWATNDGRHYLKLLPLCLKSLSERVRACQPTPSIFMTRRGSSKVHKPSAPAPRPPQPKTFSHPNEPPSSTELQLRDKKASTSTPPHEIQSKENSVVSAVEAISGTS